MSSKIGKRNDRVRFDGRILFLTEDTALVRQQLEAAGDEAKALEDKLALRLASDDLPLMNNISTDEITPGWVCFHYDETLGQYVYVGMRDVAVKKDEVRNGGVFGGVFRFITNCNPAHLSAPYAEKRGGIEIFNS